METRCPICTTEAAQVARLTVGTLWKCPQCHWLFTQDIPYKPIEKLNPDEKKRDEYLAIVQKATLYSVMENGAKVLDINCGDGTLLGWYVKRIITVGVESNASLMREALNQKRVDVAIPSEFSAEIVNSNSPATPKFEVITLVDCFQNYNPLPTLVDCKKLLSETGVLVIQVPYFSQIIKESTEDFSLCQHYFLAYTMKNAIEKAGLSLQGLELPKTGIRFYISHPGNKRFAISDYDEKLRLYVTMNTTIIQELRARFDSEAPYKALEARLYPEPLGVKNQYHAPFPASK